MDETARQPTMLRVEECAERLGVSEDFVLREITRGNLVALRNTSQRGRVTYRVTSEDWRLYLETHWPKREVRI